jgi:peptide/nickel transport system permease protein
MTQGMSLAPALPGRADQFARAGTRALPGPIRFILLIGSTPSGAIALALLTLHLLLVAVGPSLAPNVPTALNLRHTLEAPSTAFPMGTDNNGRDVLSRVMAGARSIVLLSVVSTALAMGLGILLGLIAGYLGGWKDEVTMRGMDVLMSFPALLLAMLVLTTLGPADANVILATALVFTPRVARVVRSVVLDLRTREFVDAARLRGESTAYIWLREIIPNASPVILVETGIRLSYAIVLIASLGFLGLGVQPPTPDWGLMVSDGRKYIYQAWWMVFFPSVAIASLVIAVNLFKDRLEQVLNAQRSFEAS